MVTLAGMAVLGMTATLVGAHTHQATYPLNEVMQAPVASLPPSCCRERPAHDVCGSSSQHRARAEKWGDSMMHAAFPTGFIGLRTMGEAMAPTHSAAPICYAVKVGRWIRRR
jgi:hypothetical protein